MWKKVPDAARGASLRHQISMLRRSTSITSEDLNNF